MQIVIIGGVAGGMSAATRMRRLDENAQITVLERSGYVSFANCGLPYHVGGVIEERSKLLLQTPESLGARFGIDVRVASEVVSIDREKRTVLVRNLAADGSGAAEYELTYDRLILSPGARPVRPPIPGIERALSLRDVEDTDAMVAATAGATSAVVIGGGFIGVEMAENLVHRGLKVTLVEAMPQVMTPIDIEMAHPVHEALRNNGVDLRLNSSVETITPAGVTLAGGEAVQGDIVVAAIGVRPDSALASAAGLEVGERGGISVDEFNRTSDPAIYAVGDAAEKRDAIDGSAVLVPLANTANLQGRRVADHIAGLPGAGRPVLGTAIVGVFGLQVASVGWNEKRLQALGRPYKAIHTHPASHATYYPGAEQMSLKLLLDPETDAILGAQGVGKQGVDRRIDVIATAMTGGITASALADLELAYAPQFSSAKDPVNMLGYIADNMRTGHADTIQWHELEAAMTDGVALIDVRTPGEFAAGAIPGAVNIQVDDLRERMADVPEGRVVVHCAVGLRGHTAARILTQHGREVRNLDGGYRTWLAGTSETGA
ncbi:MAG: FAD-dependent oxidoreductase [Dermatophilus congolensis]|nr:FAD-dependent oxidoreductase [Dermatophilus congolensis]